MISYVNCWLTAPRGVLQGKRVAISGSGNVAIYAAFKCVELGAKVITLSDSGGYHIVEEGMTKEMIQAIDEIKVAKKGRLSEYKNDKGELPLAVQAYS